VRSTDGGLTWYNLGPVPGNGDILGIEGTGTDFWYIRGTDIYRSSNSGDTWTLCYTGLDSLYDIDFAVIDGCPVGWAVGAGGKIIKMSGDSLVSIHNNNSQVPKEYKLYQNYPNPFNPITKIKFEIPEAAQVELKVYDALGKEVSVILNEYRQAGTHYVNFDGSVFASGLYFYKLKCGNFTCSRKMMLLK
jgi:hypothetical protein